MQLIDWSTAAHQCAWPTASRGWWPAAFAASSIAILLLLLQPLLRLLRLLRRDHPSPASSRQAGQPCCGHRHGHPFGCMSSPCDGERGGSQGAGRTGSEGYEGGRVGFREQSWKGCLRTSLNRCKPNFRGSVVYVPRSVDWHPALWCMISLIMRNNDGNQVAPLTREHPRRRYTPVDTPWCVYASGCVYAGRCVYASGSTYTQRVRIRTPRVYTGFCVFAPPSA